MKIKRNIHGQEVEITLTKEELYEAHEEHVTIFMQTVLENDFGYPSDIAEELAGLAYNEYARGNGLTEYECVEKIVNE